jgi:hypothetical protein
MLLRRILVEQARRKSSHQGGGGLNRVELGDADLIDGGRDLNLIALEDAIGRLEGEDPRAAQVVKLRCFGGLTIAQAAEAIGISPATAVNFSRASGLYQDWFSSSLAGRSSWTSSWSLSRPVDSLFLRIRALETNGISGPSIVSYSGHFQASAKVTPSILPSKSIRFGARPSVIMSVEGTNDFVHAASPKLICGILT